MRKEFTAGPDDARRLESVLRRLLPHQPLSALHKALRQGDIRVNGLKVGPDTKVAEGDSIGIWTVLLPPDSATLPARSGPAHAGLPADWVVYEGPDLLVVNKPSGVLVHSGGQSAAPPLDELVRAWLGPSTSSLSFRPGPLHRLDRETSGLVVFSKTLAGAQSFSAALANREVTKTYLAVLRGELGQIREVQESLARDEETFTTSMHPEGKKAETRFRPLAREAGMTLAEVDLGTGRTHQIRVHAQSIGYPLAGDSKYGGGPTPLGLDVPWLLHASTLLCPLLPPLAAILPEGRQRWLEKTFKFFS